MNERLAKRIYADRLMEVMRRRKISLSELARRMRTSRTAAKRPAPDHTVPGVTLDSLVRAARAVGNGLRPRSRRGLEAGHLPQEVRTEPGRSARGREEDALYTPKISAQPDRQRHSHRGEPGAHRRRRRRKGADPRPWWRSRRASVSPMDDQLAILARFEAQILLPASAARMHRLKLVVPRRQRLVHRRPGTDGTAINVKRGSPCGGGEGYEGNLRRPIPLPGLRRCCALPG